MYEYKSSTGNQSAFIHRYDWIENGKKKKNVKPFSYSDGKWDYNANGFEKPRALLNWDKLSPDKKILIVEGEKTCVFAQKFLGDEFVVLTWPFGASSVHFANWESLNPYKNNPIYVWPDNDKSGFEAANYIGKSLGESIHIVDVSKLNLPEGWDLANIGDCDPEMNRAFSKQEVLDILYTSKAFSKVNEKNEPIDLIPVEVIEKLDRAFLEKENKIDYTPHPSLKDHVKYVDKLPNFLNKKDERSVTIQKETGYVVGDSMTAVLLFCIDYFKAVGNQQQARKIAMLAMDKKLRVREYKKVKEEGKYVYKIVENIIYFTNNDYSKLEAYFAECIYNFKLEERKNVLKYNGSSFENTKKIFSTLTKNFTDEAEMAAMILIHFIVQVKLKIHNRHEEIKYHMAPFFCSTLQVNGKSTFMRVFIRPMEEFYYEKELNTIVDERNWNEHSKKFISGFDEIEAHVKDVVSKWKFMITNNTLHARILGINLDAVYRNNTSYIGTAQSDNLGEKILDSTGNRRFGAMVVKSFRNIPLTKEDKEILKELYLEESEFVFPTLSDTFFNVNYLWQLVDENWTKEKIYINEIEKVIEQQAEHLTKSSEEQFLELYEIEVGENFVPAAMVYDIYKNEFKLPISNKAFYKFVRTKFGDDVFIKNKRMKNGKQQNVFQITYNSTLEAKLDKHFRGYLD